MLIVQSNGCELGNRGSIHSASKPLASLVHSSKLLAGLILSQRKQQPIKAF
jgi:hypothetical protein